MGLRKRLISVVAVGLLLAGELSAGYTTTKTSEELEPIVSSAKETLYFWYTDDALTDYLNSVALDYYEKTDYKIVPVLKTGLEYLETIYDASKAEEEIPDLFIASNDALEKAYLAGLASKMDEITDQNYPKAAVEAVTYQDKIAGYPFYFETSAFLFNKTYMQNLAQSMLEEENDLAVAREAEALMEEMGSEEIPQEVMGEQEEDILSDEELANQAERKIGDIIPATMDDILNFANEYDAPEQVEAVFKWDVSDIFYNYFFIGNYMIVGGDTGDNPENIDIYNQNTIDCLAVYQNLNQFFSIDTKEVSYASVLQEFIDGKIVFTVATTDAIRKIEEAKAAGEFTYEYGVAPIPDLSENLTSKSLSVTNAIVINGFSQKKEIADDFAKFLVDNHADTLFARTGKVSVKKNVSYEFEGIAGFMEEYEDSIPMPKMMEASNFWVKLEICFSKIWKGAEIEAELQKLAEDMQKQITGTIE